MSHTHTHTRVHIYYTSTHTHSCSCTYIHVGGMNVSKIMIHPPFCLPAPQPLECCQDLPISHKRVPEEAEKHVEMLNLIPSINYMITLLSVRLPLSHLSAVKICLLAT